ncbi:hypothetical protein KI387_029224, partial [Taxus chinensis]
CFWHVFLFSGCVGLFSWFAISLLRMLLVLKLCLLFDMNCLAVMSPLIFVHDYPFLSSIPGFHCYGSLLSLWVAYYPTAILFYSPHDHHLNQ